MTDKVMARDHESYGTFTLITVLIPIVGFIVGIVYLTKDEKVDKKLGEHLIVVSIISTIVWWIILVIFTSSLFQTPTAYQGL